MLFLQKFENVKRNNLYPDEIISKISNFYTDVRNMIVHKSTYK